MLRCLEIKVQVMKFRSNFRVKVCGSEFRGLGFIMVQSLDLGVSKSAMCGGSSSGTRSKGGTGEGMMEKKQDQKEGERESEREREQDRGTEREAECPSEKVKRVSQSQPDAVHFEMLEM